MVGSIQFGQVVVDCEHATRLGSFYAELLGRPLATAPTSSSPLTTLADPEGNVFDIAIHPDLDKLGKPD